MHSRVLSQAAAFIFVSLRLIVLFDQSILLCKRLTAHPPTSPLFSSADPSEDSLHVTYIFH